MSDPVVIHPAPVPMRSIPQKRVNRLRLSWFVIGMFFGGLAIQLLQLPTSPSADTVLAVDTASTDAAAAPTPKAIAEAPPAGPVPTAKPEAPYPHNLTYHLKVRQGDTLLNMLTEHYIALEEARRIIRAIKPAFNAAGLRSGQDVTLHVTVPAKDLPGQLLSLEVKVNMLKRATLKRSNDGTYAAKLHTTPTSTRRVRAGGTIIGSFYQTALDKGVPENLISELIKAYSYDVDFQRDIHRGHSLDVLLERKETDTGKVVRGERIIFASLKLGRKTLDIYRYTDRKGNSGYYNRKGATVRKSLLRTADQRRTDFFRVWQTAASDLRLF